MSLRQFGTACALCLSILFSTAALAVTLDFEGIAPAGSATSENYSLHNIGGFDISIFHGHFIDAAHSYIGDFYPSHDSDYLTFDSEIPLVITKSDGGAFSLNSLDTSEWGTSQSLNNYSLNVIGYLSDGGTISFTSILDSVFSFETISFGSQWNNLIQVELSSFDTVFGGPTGSLAFDNIVLDSEIVPIPAAVWLFGSGLLGLVGITRRRKPGQPPARTSGGNSPGRPARAPMNITLT